MAKDYSEDQLIQKSAAELLEKELGWTSVYAFDKEVLGTNGTLGRTSYHEVLLTGRFRGKAVMADSRADLVIHDPIGEVLGECLNIAE